jgi:hypothetical protein
MSKMSETTRYLAAAPAEWLCRPVVRLQPVLAKQGQPNIDLARLGGIVEGAGSVAPVIAIESPEHL